MNKIEGELYEVKRIQYKDSIVVLYWLSSSVIGDHHYLEVASDKGIDGHWCKKDGEKEFVQACTKILKEEN